MIILCGAQETGTSSCTVIFTLRESVLGEAGLVKRWDLFISHASEDKYDVAIPLFEALRRAGMTVWLDAYELQIGDSIRENIDSGLAACQYGVVILSPHFIAKQWPKRELNALFALEEDGVPRILPVWHNLDRAEVVAYSPILADKLAGNTRQGFDVLASGISKVVLSDKSSPAARSPSLARRLLNVLDSSTDAEEIKQFLTAQPKVLERIFGGRGVRIKSGVRFGGVAGDIFLGRFLPTTGDRRWNLIMFGKVSGQIDVKAEFERIDAQVAQIRDSISSNLHDARSSLNEISPDFRVTLVAGRRDELSENDIEIFREYNSLAHDAEARTYDWLVEAALDNQ